MNKIKPFWSWNDRLEKKELVRQIELMKESGIEGFFMHARGGLKTEYMGEDWFDCIKACMDKADELDMEAWAYDEKRLAERLCKRHRAEKERGFSAEKA